MASVNDIPGVVAKLEAIKDPILKETATEAARVAYNQATAYVNQQAAIVKELAAYRKKLDDGTITDTEKTAYDAKKQDLMRLDDYINNAGKLVAEDVKKIKAEQLQKKLDTLKGAKGTITFATPEKIFEYVLRTQALNPYSRERACDIELLDAIVSIANQTGEEKAMLQALQALIKEVF